MTRFSRTAVRSFLASALGLAVATYALTSAAQTASLQIEENQITRQNPTHSGSVTTDLHISYGDCIADDVFEFPMTVRNPSNLQFELWVGTGDCTDPEQRRIQTNCGRALGPTELDRSTTREITVRDIVGARLKSEDREASVCDAYVENFTNSTATPVTLFFLLLQNGSDAVQTSDTWKTEIDMRGPKAPTEIDAGSGEGKLILDWSVDPDDVVGFQFYCAPGSATARVGSNSLHQPIPGAAGAPGSAGASAGGTGGIDGAPSANAGAAGGGEPTGGGGAAGDGTSAGGAGPGTGNEAGTGGQSASNCTSSVLTPGRLPTADLKEYECGREVGQTSTQGNATGLQNDVRYAVAIAAYDALGNRGPLSELACGTPVVVEDFYERYRAAGGKGGGGFCSVRAGGDPAAAYVAGAGLAAWLLRRRKRHATKRARADRGAR